VSASLLYGLPWRMYDPASPLIAPEAYQPTWNFHWRISNKGPDSLKYFREFHPIMPPIGHSIYVFHLNEEDCALVNPLLEGQTR
jgi:hypothetical protein